MTQNLHIQHPEDSILMGDLSVLDWFNTGAEISVKIDGAPAIVWGTDPQTKTFFVGTKAVFNKKKLRIAHSHDEIDLHYEGEVADILHACFDCLPRTDCIFQGDFIGFGGDDTYKPNSVKYVFPNLVIQSIIVAPHTVYVAENDLRDAVASCMVLAPKSTKDVLFVKPDGWEDEGDYTDKVKFARQMATTVEFAKTKTQARKIEKVINTFIKVNAVMDPEVLADVAECDVNLMRLWTLVRSFSDDRRTFCATSGGPLAYLGKRFIGAEGYVVTNEHGTYKLVKRDLFSRYNFKYGRFSVPNK